MSKITLRKRSHPCSISVVWTQAKPFNVNPRGHLIHRVKSAISFRNNNGLWSHDHVDYWCGGSANCVALTSDPPRERLLCAYCEAKAVAAGEKPASELVGRHVCTGTMKVQRQCCMGSEN